MTRYFKCERSKLSKKEQQEESQKLSTIEKVILHKIGNRGEDIFGLLNSCRPYINRYGVKEFARRSDVSAAVEKLLKDGYIYGR